MAREFWRIMSETLLPLSFPLLSSEDEGSDSDWDSDGSSDGGANAGGETRSYRAARLNTSASVRGRMSSQPRGTLRLDKTEARIGEAVGVYWDVPTIEPSAWDWIGIYEEGGRV